MLHKYYSSLGSMRAHVSYKAKYCHKIFTYPAIKARCEEIFLEVSEKYGFIIVEMGFDEDHVHLVIDMGVRYSAADIAKLLKGTSGKKILREFPTLKRTYFWGSGLGTRRNTSTASATRPPTKAYTTSESRVFRARSSETPGNNQCWITCHHAPGL